MSVWSGHFYDGREAAQHAAEVSLDGPLLVIRLLDGAEERWPLDSVRQSHGAMIDEPVRLERTVDGVTQMLIVTSPDFLAAIMRIAPGRFHATRGTPAAVKYAYLIAGALLAFAACVYLAIPLILGGLVRLVPLSWEERMGRAVWEQAAPANRRCGGLAQDAVDRIVHALTSAAPDSPYTIRALAIREPVVNAFAAPGGYLVVHSGLIEKTKDPEELAAVLAHEIAHTLERHVTQGLIRMVGFRLAAGLLLGDAGALAGAAEMLGALHFQRADEEQADAQGLELMRRAGIEPRAMVRMLRILEKESGDMPRYARYLSSHPLTAERIARVERLAAAADPASKRLLPGYRWSEVEQSCGTAAR